MSRSWTGVTANTTAIHIQYIYQIHLDIKKTHMDHTVPRALSWAQAAREAARRGTMLLLEAKLSLKSSRQVTRSMEGQDRMQRSDSKSLGPEERQEQGSVSVHPSVVEHLWYD